MDSTKPPKGSFWFYKGRPSAKQAGMCALSLIIFVGAIIIGAVWGYMSGPTNYWDHMSSNSFYSHLLHP